MSKNKSGPLKSSVDNKKDSVDIKKFYGLSRSPVIPVQVSGKSSNSAVSPAKKGKIDKVQQIVGSSNSNDPVSSSVVNISSGVISAVDEGSFPSVSSSNVETSGILSASVVGGLESSMDGLLPNLAGALNKDSPTLSTCSVEPRIVNRTVTNVSTKSSVSVVLSLPAGSSSSSSSGYKTRSTTAAQSCVVSDDLNFNNDFRLGATSPGKKAVPVSTPNPFEALSDEDEVEASDELVGSEPNHQKSSPHCSSVVSPLVSVTSTGIHVGSGVSSVTLETKGGVEVHRVEHEDEPTVYPTLTNPAEGTFPYSATKLPIPSNEEQAEEDRAARIESQLTLVGGSKDRYSLQAKASSSKSAIKPDKQTNALSSRYNAINNKNTSNPPTLSNCNITTNNNTSTNSMAADGNVNSNYRNTSASNSNVTTSTTNTFN